MKPFDTIKEDLRLAFREPKSETAKEARRLGLKYLGFGRYGRKDQQKPKVTHFVEDGKLKKISTRYIHSYEVKKEWDQSIDDYIDAGYWKKINRTLVSHYNATRLSRDEEKTLDHYTKEGYRDFTKIILNRANPQKYKLPEYKSTHDYHGLRKSAHDSYWRLVKYRINLLDDIIDDESHTSPTDFIAYSGNHNLSMEKGRVYLLPLFTSTSLNLYTALFFAGNKGSLLQFNIKKGQQGYYLGERNPGENEFILPRNTKIKVLDKRKMMIYGFETDVFMVDIVK